MNILLSLFVTYFVVSATCSDSQNATATHFDDNLEHLNYPQQTIEKLTSQLLERLQSFPKTNPKNIAKIQYGGQRRSAFANEEANVVSHIVQNIPFDDCELIVDPFIQITRLRPDQRIIDKYFSVICNRLITGNEQFCKNLNSAHVPVLQYIIKQHPTLTSQDVCAVIYPNHNLGKAFDITANFPVKAQKRNKCNCTDFGIIHISDVDYDSDSKLNQTLVHSPLQENSTIVYFTGNIIKNGVWNISRSNYSTILSEAYTKLKDDFNATVYPVIGNHDVMPLDLFSPVKIPSNLSNIWIYGELYQIWNKLQWLPEDTKETFLTGGYYTVKPKPGLRVIALNNNICRLTNWWMYYKPLHLSQQLQWLAETLVQAEKEGEFVHILAHMPSNTNICFRRWNEEYQRIVNRFADTIAAEFNGHTRNSEMRLYYKNENTINKAVAVAWTASSNSTTYRFYKIACCGFRVKETITLTRNASEVNNFTKDFNLKNLTLFSLQNWMETLKSNKSHALTYCRKYILNGNSFSSTFNDEDCVKRVTDFIYIGDRSNEDTSGGASNYLFMNLHLLKWNILLLVCFFLF